jgi:hypothetical protein
MVRDVTHSWIGPGRETTSTSGDRIASLLSTLQGITQWFRALSLSLSQKEKPMIQELRPIMKWVDHWTVRDCLDHLALDDELLADFDSDQLLASVWPALPLAARESLDHAFVLYDLATGRV